MDAHSSDGIDYYTFGLLEAAGLTHAVFTRHGGVSPVPYASLNLSISTGDSREHVRENRRRAFRALGRDPESIADLWQVHSATVIPVDAPFGEAHSSPKADALVTDRPEVTLMLRFADCVPILLADPRRRVAGLVHAGWKGTLLKAPAAAVEVMVARYGCRPEDILAGIGPSIGPCHYEVGPEVAEQTLAAFEAGQTLLLPGRDSRPHLDLWKANETALAEAGLLPGHIETAQLCTMCRTDIFFSHRGEGARTGRFGALVGLK